VRIEAADALIVRKASPDSNVPPTQAKQRAAANGQTGEEPLPARLASLEIAAAPMQDVAAVFSSKIGWKVKVEPGLAERRVSAHLRGVIPTVSF
ncbi:MAG TPA: hypothetical protein VGW38_02885, partial [Chloroflexota bacterium]|nr:hypothetical protein [Chloroflexota bacterium]